MTEKIIPYIKHPAKLIVFLQNRCSFKLLPDKMYLKTCYQVYLGKTPNLENPQTYCEKLQWLKLHDRNPEYTTMVDKYAAKQYIAEKVGAEYVVPTLGVWERFEDINFDTLPDRFVLKCTHDSGGIVICRDKCNFVIYFVIDEKWFDFLNIKPIVTESAMNRSIIPINYGSNFSIVFCEFIISV